MSESGILRDAMLRLTEWGARVFRNNVGVGWAGHLERVARPQHVFVRPEDVVLRNARPLHAGLCVGSSDLIGWKTVEVTPGMVGQRVAVFLAVEGKVKNGRLTEAQRQFLKVVSEAGGIVRIAREEGEEEF
jgi:hypothetical protein